MKHLIVSAAILTSTLICGCNQSRHRLSGGYSLERFDEGGTSFYVTAPGTALDGGGVFDGTVEEIGWNNDWILARVIKSYRGDTNGWYAIQLKTGKVAGPFQDGEIKSNATLSQIQVMQPTAVFR